MFLTDFVANYGDIGNEYLENILYFFEQIGIVKPKLKFGDIVPIHADKDIFCLRYDGIPVGRMKWDEEVQLRCWGYVIIDGNVREVVVIGNCYANV